MTTENPRVLPNVGNIPPFPIGGLKDHKQTETYLRRLSTALASDRGQVGDRVERRVLHGPIAGQPTADGGGNLYYATDDKTLDIDTGTWENIVTDGGISDHGDLTGLDDQTDHDWAIYNQGDTMHGDMIFEGYMTMSSGCPGLRYHNVSYYDLLQVSGSYLILGGVGSLETVINGSASRLAYNAEDLAFLSDLQSYPESFLELDDTPSDYAGYAGYGVGVNSTPDGLEFVRFVKVAGDTMTGVLEMDGGWLDLKTQPTTPASGIVSLGRTTSGDVFRMATVDGYMDLGPTPGAYCFLNSDLNDLVCGMNLQFDYNAAGHTVEFENSGSTMRSAIEFDGLGTEYFYFGDASIATVIRGLSGAVQCDLDFANGYWATFYNSEGIKLRDTSETAHICLSMGGSNNVNVGSQTHSEGLRLHGKTTEQRPYYNNGTAVQLALLSDAGGGPGTDTTAIHDNVANEITAITAITTLQDADEFVLEEANADPVYSKRAITAANLASYVVGTITPAGFDTTAFHNNALNEITALVAATPANTDVILIEDASASYAKRKVSMTALATYVEGELGGTNDPDAYHDDVAGEIHNTPLTAPADYDEILFEDYSDSWNKKRMNFDSLCSYLYSYFGTTWAAYSHNHDSRYYTETELLTTGVLDARYYTETEMGTLYYTKALLDGGALNGIYYTETELDYRFGLYLPLTAELGYQLTGDLYFDYVDHGHGTAHQNHLGVNRAGIGIDNGDRIVVGDSACIGILLRGDKIYVDEELDVYSAAVLNSTLSVGTTLSVGGAATFDESVDLDNNKFIRWNLYGTSTQTGYILVTTGNDLRLGNTSYDVRVIGTLLDVNCAIDCSSYIQVGYLSGAPGSTNGMIWVESDGLHVWYNGAEHILTD